MMSCLLTELLIKPKGFKLNFKFITNSDDLRDMFKKT